VFPSSAPARLYQETIKPGATLDLTYTFPGNFLTGEGAGPVTTAPHLPAGKYELALTIEVNGAVLTPKPAAFTMVETPTPKPLTKEETEKIIGQARQALAQNLARQVEAEKKADVNSGVPYASLTAASFVVEIERGGAGHIVKFRADLPNSDRVLTWTVGVTERGVDPNFAMYGFVSIPKHPALAPAPAAGPGTRLLQLQ
jgi:hypothetical protein